MAQVKQHLSSSARPRRINVNLPKHSATAAAFHSPTAGTLTLDRVREERARYAELVLNNTISEAFLKMPNVVTKPRSVDDISELNPTPEVCSPTQAICKLPSVPPAPFTNQKVTMDTVGQLPGPSSPGSPNQRPGPDRKGLSQRTSSISHSRTQSSATDIEKEGAGTRRSSMNPMAATFTPTFPKSTLPDGTISDQSSTPRRLRRGTIASRESVVTGLGISSPTANTPSHRQQQGTDVITARSPTAYERRSTISESSFVATTVVGASTTSITATTTTTTTGATAAASTTSAVDFDPDELQSSLVRQFSDKLETGLDRHLSQIVTATSSLPLSSPGLTEALTEETAASAAETNGTSNPSSEETAILQLKRMLHNTNAELERLKDKNQELRDTNHKLKLQHLEATHQITRLQDFEQNNQFLQLRIKELEASSGSSFETVLETASMDGRRQTGSHVHSHSQQSQQTQKLIQEIASITLERDTLKTRVRDLEEKPFVQQQQQEIRSAHFIDLENERNRLIEELCKKTVAMEDLLDKNEALTIRAKEYEKRVWELESQVAALEAEGASSPRTQAELVEMEARAEAADALAERLQDMEGQVTLVKTLQERIDELETRNAELDHSNWDLNEKLSIAENQHTLLTKEFESFRSKDKDDRRLEYLTARNRELEALVAEQNKSAPSYKDEFDRVSMELEKLKVRLPQLEGQAKQVALLRSKTSQLEKQIKTMESLEPRLGEMQQLHERNLFLEGELGELEQLRAREMELEHELEESKARLIQLETNKSRMNSFAGLKQLQTRARSGSVAQHGPPLPYALQQQQQQVPQPPPGESENSGATVDLGKFGGNVPLSHHARTSQVINSVDPIQSPRREFPPATSIGGGGNSSTSTWPSGRSSMSMSNASHRMSTSSSTSTVLSSSSGASQQRMSLQQGYSAPASPEVMSDEEDKKEIEAIKRAAVMTEESDPLVNSGSEVPVPVTVA
ncbi:hypothetical protein BGX34_010592 [Mortierella sp. NVP85]|nr:hypothetical protein BGX34_010592 [Mortierella sp. NVP85]